MEFFNVNFWQGFLGNLLATILGVAIRTDPCFHRYLNSCGFQFG